MTRTITITTERIRRVIVRYLPSPSDDRPPITVMPSTPETPTEEKRNTMNKKIIAAFAFIIIMSAVPARPQGAPLVAGLQLPSKVAFTRHHNLVVAESGTPANNSGRISLQQAQPAAE